MDESLRLVTNGSLNAYVYPPTVARNGQAELSGSPYIRFLTECLRERWTVLSSQPSPGRGVLGILQFLPRIDVIVFNWIEDVVDKRGGVLQAFVLFLVLLTLKVRDRKIVWIMHNKLSHERSNRVLKKLTAKLMLKFSSLVITHATEGVAYSRDCLGADSRKVKFVHHPFMRQRRNLEAECLYDIIIWGTVAPYKGIDRFLNHLRENGMENKYSIYIAGQISPPSYSRQIMKFSSDRIRVDDRFLPLEELDRSIAAARLIFFAYDASTVLSSAALMDSVVYGKPIVGPDAGAFHDLAEEGIIRTYRDLPDSIRLIDSILENDEGRNPLELDRFVSSNTWESFASRIDAWLGIGSATR